MRWDKEPLLQSFGSCLVQNTLRETKECIKSEPAPERIVLSLHRIRTSSLLHFPHTHLPILVQDMSDVRKALGATVR